MHVFIYTIPNDLFCCTTTLMKILVKNNMFLKVHTSLMNSNGGIQCIKNRKRHTKIMRIAECLCITIVQRYLGVFIMSFRLQKMGLNINRLFQLLSKISQTLLENSYCGQYFIKANTCQQSLQFIQNQNSLSRETPTTMCRKI